MGEVKYKLRCRKNGILVTSTPEKYDVVWKRIFNPEIHPMDRLKNNHEPLNKESPEKLK